MHMPPAGLRLGQLRYQDLDIGSVDIYEFLKETLPARVFKQLTDRFSEWRKQRQEAKAGPER